MSYRFKRPWQQYQTGDPVPDTFGPGQVQTMLDYHIIERVESEPSKQYRAPRNKASQPGGRK